MRKEKDQNHRELKLFVAVSVLGAALIALLFWYHDLRERRRRAGSAAPIEAVGFLCSGRPEAEAVCITESSEEDGYWDVFLPGSVSGGVALVCDRAFTVQIGEETYRNGDLLPVSAALEPVDAVIQNRYGPSAAGTLRFIGADGIPSVFLDTVDDDAEERMEEAKGNKEAAVALVADESGRTDAHGVCSIKIHGNTSWYADKKSYQVEFDAPTSVLGMDAQKKWILLGNTQDPSFLENAIMQTLAAELDETYCPQWKYADVYLNGAYKGLYVLIQKVDVSGGAVHIRDLEEANGRVEAGTDPPDISGGYLMELMVEQAWENARVRFETPNRWIEIKCPGDATEGETGYISGLVNHAEELLYREDAAPDKTDGESGECWEDFYDVRSWVIQYILQEISSNCDTEVNSEFFYADAGDTKLYGGPAWDFDNTVWLPTQNEGLTYIERSLHVNGIRDGKQEGGNLWLQQMDTKQSFHEAMKTAMVREAVPALQEILAAEVPAWREETNASVLADCIRWSKSAEDAFAAQERVVEGLSGRGAFLGEYYEREEDYCIVRFEIDYGRYDLLVPVERGSALHEEVLPQIHGSQEWLCEDGSPFTADTVVEHDLTVHSAAG